MSDDLDGKRILFESDEALERTIHDLRPVMRQRRQAEATQPDPEFLRSLRVHLTEENGDQQVVLPTVTRRPSPPRVGRPTVPSRLRNVSPAVWAGVSAIAVAAVLVVLLLRPGLSGGPSPKSMAFAVPRPSRSDVTRAYPVPYGQGAGGGVPAPWVNDLAPAPGSAYPSHLTLSGTAPRTGPAPVPAYKLAGPTFDVPRLRAIAATLGVAGPTRQNRQKDGTWMYIQTHAPMGRSVAISVQTGELIYHGDASPRGLAPPLRYVAAARAWLTRLGWPGAAMPVYQSPSGTSAERPQIVTLGWPVQGGANVPAATILFAANGHVQQADVWPPVGRETTITAQAATRAWADVRADRIPVAVPNILALAPMDRKSGIGTLRGTDITQVFTQTRGGAVYLVPAYRFTGALHIKNAGGAFQWFALVPVTGS